MVVQQAPSLDARLVELGVLVDGWTRESIERFISPLAGRFNAMLGYHLGWRDEQFQPLDPPAPTGKKLRPGIVLLVCEAVSGSYEAAQQAAISVELVHNFSLVHDDIQDDSALRRHRPTLWTLVGRAQAINAGDALFALAQTVLLDAPTERAAELARTLNLACLRLVEGQYLDIDLQDGHVNPKRAIHEAMIARKTGALFECAARMGAIAGGADPDTQQLYATFGRELGIAFQEQDDLLDVWGSQAETGKPAAADIYERKRGLPAIIALGEPAAPNWLKEFYAGTSDVTADEARQVVAYFDSIGVRERAEGQLRDRFDRAQEALASTKGLDPAAAYLGDICNLLLGRRS